MQDSPFPLECALYLHRGRVTDMMSVLANNMDGAHAKLESRYRVPDGKLPQ